jgi:subfamily B ATP-binding cassette protein MsbA
MDNLMHDRSSIVIAHWLPTAISADRIVVMNKGKTMDAGRHEELLERCKI